MLFFTFFSFAHSADAACNATTTGSWNTGGNWTGCAGVGGIPAAGDDVTINSGVTITLDVATPVLNSLTVAGTLDTSASNYAVNTNNLTVNSGATFTPNSSTITLSGTSGTLWTQDSGINYSTVAVVVTSDASITVFSNALVSSLSSLTVSPTITADRTYTLGGNTVIANLSITINPTASSAYTLTVNQSTASITPTTLSIQGSGSATGKFDTVSYVLTAGAITIGSGGILVGNSSTITVNNSASNIFVVNTGGIFSAGTSTVIVRPNASSTPLSGTAITDVSFYNLSLTPSPLAASRTYTLPSTLTVTNDFMINPTASSTTKLLTVNMSGTVTVGGLTTIKGTNTGTSKLDTRVSNYAFSTGTLSIENTGTLVANASNVTLSGTSGTLFTFGSSATFTSGTSTVILSGNGNATVNSGTPSFYNLSVTGTGTKTLGGNITVTNNMTLGNGTLDPTSSYTVTGSGTNIMTGNSGGTYAVQTSTFAGNYSGFETRTFNTGSTIDYALNGTQTVDSTATYYNLTISTGGTKSLNGTTTASGTLTVSGGTLDTTGSNYALVIGGMDIGASGTLLANASTLTVTGSWSNAGTFTAGTSTVTMNGATTASVGGGPTTFYNLTISHTAAKEVQFSTNALHIIHVTNTFTATGTSGNLIKLYSSSNDTKWHFHPTGTASVDYADVRDGGCETGSVTITKSNTTNSGNNESCWAFNSNPTAPSSLGPAGLVNGGYTSDNTPTPTFTLSDADGSDTVKFRIQIDDSSDFSSAVVDYTSALAAQGSTSFTVGQATGSGTYTTGSSGQTLSDGSYYWRVKNIDNSAAESSYSTANSGAVAFIVDATAPVISEVTPVSTPTNDTTPSYTFTTNEAGTISYGGDCTSATNSASSGSNTISFSALADGTHSNCTIVVTDSATNASNTLSVTSFVITEEQTNHTTYGSTANPNYIVAPPAVNTNGGGEAGLFLKNLFFGTNDPDVKRLQQYLNSRGFNIASTGPGSVGFETSFYGELTKAKVKLFQEAHRKEILTPLGYLSGTGEFGPSTRAYVNSTIGAVNIEPVITNPTTSYVFIRDLETGDRGPDVAKLQEILVKKGFLVIPPNNIPGLFGPLTKEAVMKYQSSMGLPVTGFVGPLTRDSLQK